MLAALINLSSGVNARTSAGGDRRRRYIPRWLMSLVPLIVARNAHILQTEEDGAQHYSLPVAAYVEMIHRKVRVI